MKDEDDMGLTVVIDLTLGGRDMTLTLLAEEPGDDDLAARNSFGQTGRIAES